MSGGKIALLTAGLALGACAESSTNLAVRPVGDRVASTGRVSDDLAAARGQLALGNVGLALEAFRKVQIQYPDNPAPLVGIGDCYGAMGRLDVAEVNYESALALAPHDTKILLGLARVLDLQGLSDRANEARAEAAAASAPATPAHIAAAPVAMAAVAAPAASAPVPSVGSVTVSLPAPRSAPTVSVASAAALKGQAAPNVTASVSSITVALPPARPAPQAAPAPTLAEQPVVAAPTVQSAVATSQSGPRLQRISPGEVALVTTGRPLWNATAKTQLAAVVPVQWIPLKIAPGGGQIQIVNAARAQGLASSAKSVLLKRGWRAISVRTAQSLAPRSYVLYPRNRSKLARSLAAQFAIRARYVHDGGLVVVLGRDRAGAAQTQRQS